MGKMPQFNVDPWKASEPWLRPAIVRATSQAPAMAIPVAAAAAYRRGINNPLTRAGHTVMNRPYTQEAQKAMAWMTNPRNVNPRKAIAGLRRTGAEPYWKFYTQMANQLPQLEQWRQVAPIRYGEQQSRRGRKIGPGGMALPPLVWGGANEQMRRGMRGMPHQLERSLAMAGEPQYGSVLQMIAQFLRGRKDIDLQKILKELGAGLLPQ